jgi:hypothetical protein
VLDSIRDYDDYVLLYKWHGGPTQRWYIKKMDNGKCQLTNYMNAKVMTSSPDSPPDNKIKCRISKKAQ